MTAFCVFYLMLGIVWAVNVRWGWEPWWRTAVRLFLWPIDLFLET